MPPGFQQRRLTCDGADRKPALSAPQHRVLIHWQVHGAGGHLLLAAGGVQHAVFLLDLSNFQDTRKVACEDYWGVVEWSGIIVVVLLIKWDEV